MLEVVTSNKAHREKPPVSSMTALIADSGAGANHQGGKLLEAPESNRKSSGLPKQARGFRGICSSSRAAQPPGRRRGSRVGALLLFLHQCDAATRTATRANVAALIAGWVLLIVHGGPANRARSLIGGAADHRAEKCWNEDLKNGERSPAEEYYSKGARACKGKPRPLRTALRQIGTLNSVFIKASCRGTSILLLLSLWGCDIIRIAER